MKFFRSFAFELQSATLQLKIIECSADLVPTIFEDELQFRSLKKDFLLHISEWPACNYE